MSVNLLVGSDPEGLRGAVGRLRASAVALDGARRMLDATAQGLLSGADPWLGWASTQFRTAWQEHSAALQREVEALGAAAEALERLAGDLEEAKAVLAAASAAAAAADLTFDPQTGQAGLAPMIASPDGAPELRADKEDDLHRVAGMVNLAVGEAVAADQRAAARLQAASDLAAALLLRGAGVAAGVWEGAAGGAAGWALGLQRRAGVEADQATGARRTMRAARGKPWQRGLIVDAMRARQEASWPAPPPSATAASPIIRYFGSAAWRSGAARRCRCWPSPAACSVMARTWPQATVAAEQRPAQS